MADEQEKIPLLTESAPRVGDIRNIGEPLRFTNVEPFEGVTIDGAEVGKQLHVLTKLALTSDEPMFHQLVENLANVITHMTKQPSIGVDLRRADMVLLVFKPDATAELWLDTAAFSLRCTVKRSIAAGTAVFERDIADVTGMSFPCVTFGPADKVLCLFRENWRFGFAFDMNPEGKLDIEGFTMTLGTLYRNLHYKQIYDAISEVAFFDKLLDAGWFPFVEIITVEFRDLLDHCEAGGNIGEAEDQILANFNAARMQHILARWSANPHFAAKANLLNAAINAFCKNEPIAAIKIVLTEIEGVLNDAYRAVHGGKGAKLNNLLDFAEVSAERKAGGPNTLLLPKAFGRYLREHNFVNFDPIAQTGTAGSRHAVGHGAAAQDSYTMQRALQAILTLDQLFFYT